MIRKYKNEIILLSGIVMLVAGVIYQWQMSASLDRSIREISDTKREISETITLQKVWSTKGIKQKLSQLHATMPPSKIKTYAQKKSKLTIELHDLASNELNKISTKIASIPLRIKEFSVLRDGDQYTLKCRCTW